MSERPRITVAAIAQRDGRFLIVEEDSGSGRVLNQPAGHVEGGEGLVDAVIRETLEETAWHFRPRGLVGIYRWQVPGSSRCYIRACFWGDAEAHDPARALDPEIVAAHWLEHAEIVAERARLRSPMVLRCIDDFLAGRRFPLGLLSDLG